MTTTIEVNRRFLFMSDVLAKLGNVPAERVRLHPSPGTVTLTDLRKVQKREGLYELIDDTLVRKPMGSKESRITQLLSHMLLIHILEHHSGLFYGESSLYEFEPGVVLSPDLSLVPWDRVPNRQEPDAAIMTIMPNLVIEVLSQSNTAAEMRRKRVIYFKGGVERVWEVDIKVRTLTAYHTADEYETYTRNDIVPGEPMMPGFELSLTELFGV